MYKYILIALAILASTVTIAEANAQQTTKSSIFGNVINLTVNCQPGEKIQKHAQSHTTNNNININVTCPSSGGGVGQQGPPGPQGPPGIAGKNGLNGTVSITVLTANNATGNNGTQTNTSATQSQSQVNIPPPLVGGNP